MRGRGLLDAWCPDLPQKDKWPRGSWGVGAGVRRVSDRELPAEDWGRPQQRLNPSWLQAVLPVTGQVTS